MANKEKARIMIVDDSEFSRKSMAKILEDEGYNVVGEASKASEAFEIIKSSDPNIAIIDIVMPDVNGLELAEHILEKYDDSIEIIMISSLAHEHLILESISTGAVDFLQKPFVKEDLIASIDKILTQIKRDESL